jgi:glycosyltransferase involved in cell wall biosynthesis
MLTILNVAYPLAPVAPDAVGGAEQVLGALDAALVERGHRSLVVAGAGSQVHGTLLALPPVPERIDDRVRRAAQARQREVIAAALEREEVDLVHMHGIDFAASLPPPGVPVLATLHLPPNWYPPAIFQGGRPGTYLNCVSVSQERACPPGAALLPFVENGVPLALPGPPVRRRNFVLALGRICPEKGFHHALDAARSARVPLLLAGRVFGYPAHERYFREEIAPRLDGERRFLGALGPAWKHRLLSAARCLLIPSLVAETSSLVAMEALARGTPVVAFRAGALVDLIEAGRTGFLVNDAEEMAEAIGEVDSIDPERCRAAARERFDQARMVGSYLELYQRLAAGGR